MGLFSDVGKAKFAGREPFFNANAEYLIEVQGVECYQSRDPTRKGANFFKIRGRILAVSHEEKGGADALKPGQVAVHMINLGNGEAALGDVKNFATAVYRTLATMNKKDPDKEVRPDEFGDADIQPIYDPSQIAAGVVLGLRTDQKTTRENKPFTQHFWSEQDQIAWVYGAPDVLQAA